MSEPRPYTEEELRTRFLSLFLEIADEWASLAGKTRQDRCRGMAFSILAMLDGDSSLPSCDLLLRPPPEDKPFHQERGERWIEDETMINDGVALHELWHDFARTTEKE